VQEKIGVYDETADGMEDKDEAEEIFSGFLSDFFNKKPSSNA
jgi:hypothetical protein